MPQMLSIPQAVQFPLVKYEFAVPKIVGTQTATAMNAIATDATSGTLSITDYVMPWAGSIVAMAVRLSAVGTSGILTLVPTINGSAVTPAAATISMGTAAKKFVTFDGQTSGLRWAAPTGPTAPATIGVNWATSSYLPAGSSDLHVVLYVLFENVQA